MHHVLGAKLLWKCMSPAGKTKMEKRGQEKRVCVCRGQNSKVVWETLWGGGQGKREDVKKSKGLL